MHGRDVVGQSRDQLTALSAVIELYVFLQQPLKDLLAHLQDDLLAKEHKGVAPQGGEGGHHDCEDGELHSVWSKGSLFLYVVDHPAA